MMKPIVMILLLVGCTFSTIADSAPSELKHLQSIRDKKTKEVDRAYIKALEKLKVKYTKRGDLDSANAIERELELFAEAKQNNKTKTPPTTVVLLPEDADIKGKDIQINDELECLHLWNHAENISFDIPDLSAGDYTVLIKYSAGRKLGSKLAIKINNKTFKEEFIKTGSWQNTMEKLITGYKHDGGRVIINLSVLEGFNHVSANVNIYSITFTKK